MKKKKLKDRTTIDYIVELFLNECSTIEQVLIGAIFFIIVVVFIIGMSPFINVIIK